MAVSATMRLLAAAFLVGGVVGAASACLVALVPPEAAGDDGLAALKATFRRPDGVPFPRDNTFSERKRALGEALFHDKRLSADGSLACAGCHDARSQLHHRVVRDVAIGEHGEVHRLPLNDFLQLFLGLDGDAAGVQRTG